MEANTLDFRLTDEERARFERDGYLVLPGVLEPAQVERLVGVVDRRYDQERREGLEPHEPFILRDFIPVDDAFVELVDHARVFPKVWGVLGHNIYVYHAHLGVNPPLAGREPPSDDQLCFHQDSGRVNYDIETHPRPRLSVKVAYFLEGDPQPGNANLYVVPGSHLSDESPVEFATGHRDRRSAEVQRFPGSTSGEVPEAVAIGVEPGTAVIFDRRLWHSRSPNFGTSTRKVLFYGYAYRWLRTKDEMSVRHLYPHLDPIRRQLLGDGQSTDGYYSPTPADVPLRAWLEQHAPEEFRP